MIKSVQLPITGMSCTSCSRAVENQVAGLAGLLSSRVDHAKGMGEFVIDEQQLSLPALIATINQGHYKVDIAEGNTNAVDEKPVLYCPECKHPGAVVPNTVLRSNLRPEVFKQVNMDDDFFICMDPACEVAYFTVGRQLIPKQGLKRELYFKADARRQIICYCNNVDRRQIETAVKQDITDWEGTMARYSNKVQEKCEILNPTGLCCRPLFDEVVADILANR